MASKVPISAIHTYKNSLVGIASAHKTKKLSKNNIYVIYSMPKPRHFQWLRRH
ncbi:hypothetical protein MUDAN_MDHGFNIF_02716 [Lactiplantibacillus mudanjiangensis]|uniref:Uncharacterized protein n=1 Tax=Lactiplantibacillus mudanjiangensis TaxID=1296538 RepID=A0A660DW73_9LACO|nr:hypothetical protein MUDAN_IGPPGNFN_03530 [Lactiplantibacillus mudanjiangensis]VDG27899.1 hypothetical protein MUDAN_MDHGFNIF_02716 [Lactiplantibacillus mudanjiangensis]